MPPVAATAKTPSPPSRASDLLQGCARQPPAGVRGDREDIGVHDRGRRGDRGVRLVGRGQPQPAGRAAVLGDERVPRGHERGQVADRAALDEAAARLVRHAGQVGQPAQGLVLGVHGAGRAAPAARIHRRGGQGHVEQLGRMRGGGGDEGEEAGVLDRDAGRGERLGEDLQGRLAADAVLGHRLARRRSELLRRARRRKRPGRAMQALADVGDDVVGHRSVSVVTRCIAAGSAAVPGRRCSGSAVTSLSFRPAPARA